VCNLDATRSVQHWVCCGYPAGYLSTAPPAEFTLPSSSERWRYWQPIGPALPPVAVRHPDGTTRQILPVTLPEPFDEMFQSWDCAFKELKSSDYVVGQVWGRRAADK